jgi:predicted GH43/DUF377 family glycosyl hydrolase
MQLHSNLVETRCGQWIDKDLPPQVAASLVNARPMPEKFWIVDQSAANMPGCRAYNPSIIREDGKTLMSFRRHGLDDYSQEALGVASHIVMCELDNAMAKATRHRVVSGLVGPNSEDARLFRHNGKLHISYTSAEYTPANEWKCMMNCAELRHMESSALLHYDTRFGVNGAAHEKNWTYFSVGGMLRFVYNIEPLIVFEVETRKIWYHRHDGEWVFGVPHGGTPPIKVGDLWYSFFHSYRRDKTYKRRYFVGAYAFDDDMKVKAFTPWPIMASDASDGFCFDITKTTWSPLVALPCGAIYENGKWLVSVGINDSYCGIMEVDHENLVRNKLREVLTS